MATTAFPSSISPESLLPVLTTQLGSEVLARQVIKTLEKAAEDEAKKRRAAAITPVTEAIGQSPPRASVIVSTEQRPMTMSTIEEETTPKPFITIAPTIPIPSSALSTSNILNVPSNSTSPASFRAPSSLASLKRPSPSTSACSIKSSSTITSDKPFPVNTRGRKRVYTDEERRLRKNFSSKKSREKHTEKVMEKRMKLQQLQQRHRELVEKRLQLEREIKEHRSQLCPYCLNVVEEALREIGKGQDIVVLKRVNFCCSTYHAAKRQDSTIPDTGIDDTNIVPGPSVKQEHSEFTE